MQIKSLETWMRCVAEIYSVSNTYQTDKFQYFELIAIAVSSAETAIFPGL